MQATDHYEEFLDRFMATSDGRINDHDYQYIFYGGLPGGMGGIAK